MKKITYKERLQALLDETVEYYRTHSRGLTITGSCNYQTPAGDMCAAGRLMTKRGREKVLNRGNNGASIRVLLEVGNINFIGRHILLTRAKDVSADFLDALQSLHDEDCNWVDGTTGSRLSGDGEIKLNAIRVKVEDGFYGVKGVS